LKVCALENNDLLFYWSATELFRFSYASAEKLTKSWNYFCLTLKTRRFGVRGLCELHRRYTITPIQKTSGADESRVDWLCHRISAAVWSAQWTFIRGIGSNSCEVARRLMRYRNRAFWGPPETTARWRRTTENGKLYGRRVGRSQNVAAHTKVGEFVFCRTRCVYILRPYRAKIRCTV